MLKLLCISDQSLLLVVCSMVTGPIFNTHNVEEEGDGHHWWTVPFWSLALACLFINEKVSFLNYCQHTGHFPGEFALACFPLVVFSGALLVKIAKATYMVVIMQDGNYKITKHICGCYFHIAKNFAISNRGRQHVIGCHRRLALLWLVWLIISVTVWVSRICNYSCLWLSLSIFFWNRTTLFYGHYSYNKVALLISEGH